MARGWHRAAAAAALLLLPAVGGAQGLFGSLKGALRGGGDAADDAQQQERTRLEAFRAAPGDAPCGGDGSASLLHARVEQGFGVIDAPALDRHLDAILAKLVAVSPRPDCRVRVRVTPHDAAQAVALDDGGILVAIGFLRNLHNDDEVAALLAHELTHVLRRHHASDAFVDSQDALLKGIDSANVAGGLLLGVADRGLGKKLEQAQTVGGAVHSVSENMIAPAWTRDQEDEADLLGADLAAAAGYNPGAMGRIMEVIAVQEEAAAQVAAERAKLRRGQLKETAVAAVKSTDTSSTWSIIANVSKVVSAAAESASDAKKSHRSAGERQQSVNDYVRRHHRQARRRQYAEAPWQAVQGDPLFVHYQAAAAARRQVHGGGDAARALELARSAVQGAVADHAYPRLALAEALLKRGDRAGALHSLAVARQRADAPWQVYRAAADLQLGTGDSAAAAATVLAGDRALGEPLGIAPFAIRIFRRAGDRVRMLGYLDRCDAAGKREHLAICLDEAGLSHEQYRKQKLLR